jgi:hypothetical protein
VGQAFYTTFYLEETDKMITAGKIQRFILIAALLMNGWAAAVLVDNFNNYTTGNVDTVTSGKWVSSPTGTTMTIAADPSETGNQVLSVNNNGAQSGVYGILPTGTVVTNNTTKTLFTRFYITNTAYDTSFGLSTNDIPDRFDNFNVQMAVVNGTFRVRNASTNTTVGPALTTQTWYYVWAVINNTANTYSVYLKTTAADATSTDRVATDFAFRTVNGTYNPDGDMDRFFSFSNYGSSGTPAVSYSATSVLLDDIHISDGVDLSLPASNGAFNPTPANGATNVLTTATLSWNTGLDPNNPANPNPNITKHYVSFRKGDPNLASGATLAEVSPASVTSWVPPTTGSNAMALDGTYYWRIDESVNNSSRTNPNTIRGSVWSFATQKSTPTITVQPADVRVFTTDPNAVFTVTYTSINLPTATWYKNSVAITPDGTNVKVSTNGTSSTLEIVTPELSDEGKYYCILSVDPSKTTDDIQTATRLLVIKKTLAQFDFENNLNDSSGNGAPAGLAKYVNPADPNEMKATSTTISYVPGRQGQAVSLTSGQFIDFGTAGYPKAGPLDTIGDIRGTGYEKQGFGRGMDQGSILCWVKPSTIGGIYANANNNTVPATDDTLFGLTTTATNNARIIVRGENAPDGGYQEIGTASGGLQMTNFTLQDGQWHMFAATWDDSGVRVYINGEQVAANSAGIPERYNAWERANLLGATRTTARHILTDFFTGAVDSLRVYNYVISADIIATEYETRSGNTPCANHSFDGSAYNFDNTASSYCKVDIVDFALFASEWLKCGLYPDCP